MELNQWLSSNLQNTSRHLILLNNLQLIYLRKMTCKNRKKRNSKGEIAVGCVKDGARSSSMFRQAIKTLLFTFHLRSIKLDRSLQMNLTTEWYLQEVINSILNIITKEYSQIPFRRVTRVIIRQIY